MAPTFIWVSFFFGGGEPIFWLVLKGKPRHEEENRFFLGGVGASPGSPLAAFKVSLASTH